MMRSPYTRVSPPAGRPVSRPGRAATRHTQLLFLSFAVLVLAVAPSVLHAQDVIRGTLHTVWDGGEAASYYVVDPAGTERKLVIEDGERAAMYLGLDRQAVELVGAQIVPRGADRGPDGIRAHGGVRAAARTSAELSDVVRDARNFVTVLCRFADEQVPFEREAISEVHGAHYPGVRHYFAELAWDPGLMAGSTVTDWYELPKPRTAYVSELLTDFGALARDCTAAADEDVDFTKFYGINLQFSGALSHRLIQPYDVLSFGGSWTLTLDEVTRTWGMTWLSAEHATTRAVVMHEMGHALGWPHSSGGNGSEYDSEWDVMSRGYLRWEPPHGWLSVHTIAQHKDAAGWVPVERRWTPENGRRERGTIVPTALPPDDGYLFARVPAGDTHYTVEVRRQAGHDQPLPGNAVVIHHVRFSMANVVVADGHTDPNGVGAQWLPGEEYHDAQRGLSIRVEARTDDGFDVSITRGWRLDVTSEGPGRVIARTADASLSCDSACDLVVTDRGAMVHLEPAPAMAAEFSHWTGACAAAGSVCEVALDRNRVVTAVFGGGVALKETLLPRATVGELFEATLRPRDPATAHEWRIMGGALPEGVRFDPEQFVVRGVAVEAGSFTFTVAADGVAAMQRYVLDVAPPHLAIDAVLAHVLGGSGLRAADVEYLDRVGNRNGRLDIGDLRHWLLEQVRTGAIEERDARALQQFVERTQ